MLQSAYLLAQIGTDTAENERQFAEILPIDPRAGPLGPAAALLHRLGLPAPRLQELRGRAVPRRRRLRHLK